MLRLKSGYICLKSQHTFSHVYWTAGSNRKQISFRVCVHVCFCSRVVMVIFFSLLLGDCVDNTEKKPRKRTSSKLLVFLGFSCFFSPIFFPSQPAFSFYGSPHLVSIPLIGRQRSSSPSEEETTCKRPRWQDESGDCPRLLLTPDLLCFAPIKSTETSPHLNYFQMHLSV